MEKLNGGRSENPEENQNLSGRAGPAPGRRGNIETAVRSKPSFATAGAAAHAVSFTDFNVGFFDRFHVRICLCSGNGVRCAVPPPD